MIDIVGRRVADQEGRDMFEDRAEFVSEKWVSLARAYLQARLDQADTRADGAQFSLCEIMTDCPAHFGLPGNVAAWHARLVGGRLTVGPGETYMQGTMRPYDDYLHIDPGILARNPPELSTLAGRDDIFGKNNHAGQQRQYFARAAAVRQTPITPPAAVGEP